MSPEGGKKKIVPTRGSGKSGGSSSGGGNFLARLVGIDYYWPVLVLGFAVVILLGVLFGQYVARSLMNKNAVVADQEELAPMFAATERHICAFASVPERVRTLCDSGTMASEGADAFCETVSDSRKRVYCFDVIPIEIKDLCREAPPASSPGGNSAQAESERKFCTEIQELPPTSVATIPGPAPEPEAEDAPIFAPSYEEVTEQELASLRDPRIAVDTGHNDEPEEAPALPEAATAAESSEPEPEASLYSGETEPQPTPIPPQPEIAEPTPEPQPEPTPLPPQDGPRELSALYRVQVGIFRDRENADKLVVNLGERGYNAVVGRVVREGQELFRVQVGAYSVRENAEQVAGDLTAAGYSAVIVTE